MLLFIQLLVFLVSAKVFPGKFQNSVYAKVFIHIALLILYKTVEILLN